MPRDNVEINYGVTGVQQSVTQINTLNAAVGKTASVGQDADKSTADVGAGISALGQTISIVNPQVGQYIGLIEGAKFASEGMAAGLSNVAAAGKSLIAFFANPAIIGAAALFLGIGQAVRDSQRAQEQYNDEMAAYRKRVEEARKAVDDLKATESARASAAAAPIAETLANAGLPVSETGNVGRLIADVSEQIGLIPDKVSQAFTEFVNTRGVLPTQEQLAFVAGARATPTFSGADIATILRQEPVAGPEIARRSQQRADSAIGDIARQQAEQLRSAIQSGTLTGRETADLREQLQRAEERVLELEASRPRLLDEVASQFGITGTSIGFDKPALDELTRRTDTLEAQIQQEALRAAEIQSRLDSLATQNREGPFVPESDIPQFPQFSRPPLSEQRVTNYFIYGNPSFNGTDSPTNRGGEGLSDRYLDGNGRN